MNDQKRYKKSLGQKLSRDFKMNKWKYIIILPVIVYFILFSYKPMYGLLIAFQDYTPFKGMSGSSWVGFKHFINFFKDYYFMRVLRNTVVISFLTILFGFPAPIIFALLLAEFSKRNSMILNQTFPSKNRSIFFAFLDLPEQFRQTCFFIIHIT